MQLHCSYDYHIIDWHESANRTDTKNQSNGSKLNNIRSAASDWFDVSDESKISNNKEFWDSGKCGPHEQPILLFFTTESIGRVAHVCLCIIGVRLLDARNWFDICIRSKEVHTYLMHGTHRYRRPWRPTVNYKSTNSRPNISITVHHNSCAHNQMCYFFFHLSLFFIFEYEYVGKDININPPIPWMLCVVYAWITTRQTKYW